MRRKYDEFEMPRSLGALTLKQTIAAVMGPVLLVLAMDSAIHHAAGKGISHFGQLVPLAFGVLGGAVLSVLGFRPVRVRTVRLCVRFVGAASALVGGVGTIYHLIPLVKDLLDEPFSLEALEGAISVAPPMFAPGAFCGIGVLLWFLGAPELSVTLKRGDAHDLDDAEERLAAEREAANDNGPIPPLADEEAGFDEAAPVRLSGARRAIGGRRN